MIKWKTIEEFNNYEVSNTGLVRRIGKINCLAFSLSIRNTTYQRVTLFKNNNRFYFAVHRLVAKCFVPNPNNLPQVDHVDTNGENNYASNLEWVSASENILRSFKTNPNKINICRKGGREAAITARKKANIKYKIMLGHRFRFFYGGNTIHKDAAVEYWCRCGVIRIASVMWKELRTHKGKCPICTNTVNRSSESLIK